MPLGVFRTWVKYIEKGAYPNTRRHFTVLRCNHCDDAPCIAICPTKALFRREDGIVDFDTSRCIGCKSCMQACPYDALYIDPLDHTAQKCNFCAHRVDVGLKPACEIVCPETAIVSGDLDDPESSISRLIAREPVHVRKPEQGTQPKLFYINADELTLTPNLSERTGVTMWGQIGTPGHGAAEAFPTALASPQRTSMAEGTARDVYDIAHPAPWGWRVSSYLWTKSIAATLIGSSVTVDASIAASGSATPTRIAPTQNSRACGPRIIACAASRTSAFACGVTSSALTSTAWRSSAAKSSAASGASAAPLSSATEATASAAAPARTAWTTRWTGSNGDCQKSRPSACPKRNPL